MSKFGPDPAQIASHADHIVARHVFGGMPQWRTRRWCVASMRELKPPPPVLLVQVPLPPPEWMASSPLLPGVLFRPHCPSCSPPRATTMAGNRAPSFHMVFLLQCFSTSAGRALVPRRRGQPPACACSSSPPPTATCQHRLCLHSLFGKSG